ncbi:MAG TPA: sigma 54-interacting transcriptional regulator [Candidatus Acidoferrales bacterium]|jgi:formate hydrogenlyase transcriptional activator|nr:sigma 54-interacting transcriptional regulator [Candidatus Acidoferrales bacterium]
MATATQWATHMTWGNRVPSENQSHLETFLTEREYEHDIAPHDTAESTSSALLSIIESRSHQALKGKGVNDGFAGIVGASETLREVLKLVQIVAPTSSTTLIQGETGTGKDLIAHAIHNLSSRRGRPFVKLNCAAIPLDLLESELFGHERGAFTGAIAHRVGRFELADKGTLFLDEVGDIPLALQPKLLRVLQEQEFERLGSTRTQQVDVRLVAATNRNLEEMVKRNEFRSDLYYRLNVFPISLPPLRARCEDIPAMVEHFVEIYARRMGKQIDRISSEAMSELISYPWPGNIRQLQNFIERSVILSSENVLRPPSLKAAAEPESKKAVTLEEAERDHICKTLETTRWVVAGPNGAAARLRIHRSTLYYRLQKLGIERPSRKNRG